MGSIPLGASPAEFALYRVLALAALSGLLEHSNFRLPQRLEAALSWVVSWPAVHKIHRSRDTGLTNTHYGNLLSLWDRLFSSFTPAREARNIAYGLADFDEPEAQTTAALLRRPLSHAALESAPVSTRSLRLELVAVVRDPDRSPEAVVDDVAQLQPEERRRAQAHQT